MIASYIAINIALIDCVVALLVLIIAVIGLFDVDIPLKKALLSIVSFCRLKPTQNLAGIFVSVQLPSSFLNSSELIAIELLLLNKLPIARLSSFMIPALFMLVLKLF